MTQNAADESKIKAVKKPAQRFFVPSLLRSVSATELETIKKKAVIDKTNQEVEVGDGNS